MKLWSMWPVIVLEIISPVPAVLSLGAIYVLLARPPWFLAMVRTLYAEDHS